MAERDLTSFPIDMNAANFSKDVISTTSYEALAFFYNDWCTHCIEMIPKLGDLGSILQE